MGDSQKVASRTRARAQFLTAPARPGPARHITPPSHVRGNCCQAPVRRCCERLGAAGCGPASPRDVPPAFVSRARRGALEAAAPPLHTARGERRSAPGGTGGSHCGPVAPTGCRGVAAGRGTPAAQITSRASRVKPPRETSQRTRCRSQRQVPASSPATTGAPSTGACFGGLRAAHARARRDEVRRRQVRALACCAQGAAAPHPAALRAPTAARAAAPRAATPRGAATAAATAAAAGRAGTRTLRRAVSTEQPLMPPPMARRSQLGAGQHPRAGAPPARAVACVWPPVGAACAGAASGRQARPHEGARPTSHARRAHASARRQRRRGARCGRGSGAAAASTRDAAVEPRRGRGAACAAPQRRPSSRLRGAAPARRAASTGAAAGRCGMRGGRRCRGCTGGAALGGAWAEQVRFACGRCAAGGPAPTRRARGAAMRRRGRCTIRPLVPAGCRGGCWVWALLAPARRGMALRPLPLARAPAALAAALKPATPAAAACSLAPHPPQRPARAWAAAGARRQ